MDDNLLTAAGVKLLAQQYSTNNINDALRAIDQRIRNQVKTHPHLNLVCIDLDFVDDGAESIKADLLKRGFQPTYTSQPKSTSWIIKW